jgi:spore germination protein KB
VPPPSGGETWRVRPYQLALLSFVLIAGTAVLSLPQPLVAYAGQEAWLAALLPLPVGLLPLCLLCALQRRRPGCTLAGHARAACGPLVGGALGVVWALFLASALPIVLREFADLVSGEVLPRTPQVVVLALLILVPTFMARQSLEPNAHVAGVLIPLAAGTLLFIFLPSLGAARLERMFPIAALGWGPLLQAAAPVAAFYGETALLGFVLPFCDCGPRRAFWAAALGLGAVGAVLAGATLWALLVFGPLTAHLPNTLFQVTRVAGVAEFITHLDALLVGIWVAAGLVKVSLWLLCLSLDLAQALGLAEYRPLTLPLAAFAVVAGQTWFASSAAVTKWIEQVWPFWGLSFEIGVPGAVWLATVLGEALARRGSGTAPPAGPGEDAA